MSNALPRLAVGPQGQQAPWAGGAARREGALSDAPWTHPGVNAVGLRAAAVASLTRRLPAGETRPMRRWIGRIAVASLPAFAAGCAASDRPPEPTPGAFSSVPASDAGVLAAAAHAVDAQRASMRAAGDTAAIELLRVREARRQVVAGVNYRLEMTVLRAGAERAASAEVWWQAWRQPDPYRLTRWSWH